MALEYNRIVRGLNAKSSLRELHMPMTAKYRAVLRGDQLEWRDEAPPEVARGQAVPVDITVLREERLSALRKASSGKRMAEALEKLAARDATSRIEDPVAWQREIRRDRTLPGRD